MPREQPTPQKPSPETRTIESLYLPFMILDSFGVKPKDRKKHLWFVEIGLVGVTNKSGRQVYKRRTRILHDGVLTEENLTNA